MAPPVAADQFGQSLRKLREWAMKNRRGRVGCKRCAAGNASLSVRAVLSKRSAVAATWARQGAKRLHFSARGKPAMPAAQTTVPRD
jgi:hypothetical protein